jgi:hypothetical protein
MMVISKYKETNDRGRLTLRAWPSDSLTNRCEDNGSLYDRYNRYRICALLFLHFELNKSIRAVK